MPRGRDTRIRMVQLYADQLFLEKTSEREARQVLARMGNDERRKANEAEVQLEQLKLLTAMRDQEQEKKRVPPSDADFDGVWGVPKSS